jgi:hypothetical protein
VRPETLGNILGITGIEIAIEFASENIDVVHVAILFSSTLSEKNLSQRNQEIHPNFRML